MAVYTKGVQYYKVLVGDAKFHGEEALTYSSKQSLLIGALVLVPLRNRTVFGIVESEVAKPSFSAKSIHNIAPAKPLPPQLVKLSHWMSEYYAVPLGATTRLCVPPVTSFPKAVKPLLESKKSIYTPPALTPSQAKVVTSINSVGYHLLHGITGSGKTRVYIELARKAMAAGRSILVVTPEIGLTTQLAASFEKSLAGSVVVLHSRMTHAERRNIWYRINMTDTPLIILGPRSALFAPIHDIGLIIIDESHDPSLKSDTSPKYRADRVGAVLARLHKCPLVCGTATPTIEETYIAQQKGLPILTLNKKAIISEHQIHTQIIDMKDRALFGQSHILSTHLLETMLKTLQSQQQTLLFLNRRGTANAIVCSDCGWHAECTHCDLPLSYHKDAHSLRCHVCGRNYPMPTTCPECGNTDILLKNIGTKAVVDEVIKRFPSARVARFDTDTHKSEQLETAYAALRDGAIDILVGTQMLSKGLDLPKLQTVGILNADSSLHIPDYTASERTYQLLNQVIGRVGRGHTAGDIVVQTYEPSHPAITHAINNDYGSFYRHELIERRTYLYPPFVFIMKLTCLRASSKTAEAAATKLKSSLETAYLGVTFEGPAPTFHPRENGKFRWQIIVKSTQRGILQKIAHSLPANWQFDIEPTNLL